MSAQSEARQAFRRSIFERAGYRCEACGREDKYLQFHHRTYRRFNKEHSEDIEVLCTKCHGARHAYHPDIDGIDPLGIRALRKALGVSQVALAKYLGVENDTVGAWEKGRMPQTKCRAALHELARKKRVPTEILKFASGVL